MEPKLAFKELRNFKASLAEPPNGGAETDSPDDVFGRHAGRPELCRGIDYAPIPGVPDRDKDLPEIPPGHLESQPRNYRHLRLGFAMHDVPEETVRRGRELYYGLSEWMDDQVGHLLGGDV